MLVDYSSRGPDLFAVIYRLAAEGGCEALTVRKIAAGFGLSAGSLRHQFPDQHDLLRLTMLKLARDRARRRAMVSLPSDALGRLQARCVHALPHETPDNGSFIEARAWLAFEERARHDDLLGAVSRQVRGEVLTVTEGWLRSAGVAADELLVETRRLQGLIEGLTGQQCASVDPLDVATARHALALDLERYAE